MKIRLYIIFMILVIAIIFLASSKTAFAETDEKEDELLGGVSDIVDDLDLSDLQKLLDELSESQRNLIGGGDAKEFLNELISGEANLGFSSVFEFIGVSLREYAFRYIPTILSLIAVAIAYSVLSSLRPDFASDSVSGIVRFVAVGIILTVLLTQIIGIVSSVATFVNGISAQINAVFPILLTLMTAIGASSSVEVYQPAVLVLSSGISNLLTAVALPALMLSLVFTAIGGLSKGGRLSELSSFFSSVVKWVLSTTFFVFLAFLSVQGITASIYDGIAIRTTKFALSNYVPVIGGYLSDGFNAIMAGSVLVKNSVGLMGILLMFATFLPLFLNVVIFNLSLKFAAAITEPLCGKEISSLIGNTGKNLNLLVAIVLGLAFVYFLFILLIICTGNLAL